MRVRRSVHRRSNPSFASTDALRARRKVLAGAIVFALLTFGPGIVTRAQAANTCTWNDDTGNWSDTTKWDNCNTTFPGTGASSDDDVVIASGSGLVTMDVGNIDAGALTIGTGIQGYVYAGAAATNERFTAITIRSVSLTLANGAGIRVAGDVIDGDGLSVDGPGSSGGSTLTIGGNLTDSWAMAVGNKLMTAPALVTVGGTFTANNAQTLYITGGANAAATATLTSTGPAPSTLTHRFTLTSNAGAAILRYGSGGSGITQISNTLVLDGPRAFIEVGDTNSNSALANLATINAPLYLDDGAAVTTTGALTVNNPLVLDNLSHGLGGSSFTAGGDVVNNYQVALGSGAATQTAPTTLTVHGTYTATNRTQTLITGGDAAGGTATLAATGAAPSTLVGTYTLTGNAGGAVLQYGTGSITQIGDGASNGAYLTLNGANAFVQDAGAPGSDSALAGLTTIASNGELDLENGATATTTGALTVDASGWLYLDNKDTTLNVGGDLTNHGNLTVTQTSLAGGDTTLTVAGNFNNTGSTYISGGYYGHSTVSVAGSASNSGTVEIGGNGNVGSLAVNGGAYTQSAGTTTIEASSDLSAGQVFVNGGMLHVLGTVTGNVINNATVTGAEEYTRTIDGTFVNDSGGTYAASQDVRGITTDLVINGSLTLEGGTIKNSNGGGYAVGWQRTVLNFTPGSLTGVFGSVQNGTNAATPGTSTDVGDGLTMGVVYNDHAGNIQLVVAPTPGTTAEIWNDGTGNWDTGPDWDTGAAPQFYSDVTIGLTANGNVTLGHDATIQSLVINAGNTLAYDGTTPATLSVGKDVTVNAHGVLSLPASGDKLALGGTFTNSGNTTISSGQLYALGAIDNTGPGAHLDVGSGSMTSLVGITNSGVSATITLEGGTINAPSFDNATISSTLFGAGTVNAPISNAGIVNANGGTLVAVEGIQGSGNITVDPGATLDLSQAGVDSSVGYLTQNGALDLGSHNINVSTGYTNANFGSGDSFNKHANVTGTGQILATGNVAQAITGSNVTGGNTGTPTLAFGNVHVGTTNNATYAIQNTGTTGPALRIDTQTGVNGGNITDASLSGVGVSAGLFGSVGPGSSSGGFLVTYKPTAVGALTGQAVHIANNFDNVAEQTMAITGAAYAYANPTVASANGLNFGVVQVGQSFTDNLTVTNTLVAAGFQEGLDASFGTSTNTQLTGSGSITNLAAGNSDSSSMAVNLTPVTAGTLGGTITVNLTSDGATTSGLGTTVLSPQGLDYTWQLTAVNQASPDITPNPVAFGNVRQGSTASQALTVVNSDLGAPQASLDVQLGTTSGAATAGGSSINDLAPGGSDSTSFTVGLNTAIAGHQSGAVQITLQSDSTPNGCSSDCIVSLADQTVHVSGVVYREANPGVFTSVSEAARVGDTVPSVGVDVLNDSPDPYTEGLDASFTGTTPAGFTTSGTITNLGANADDSTSLQVGVDTTHAGHFTGNATVAFTSNGLIDGATPVSVGTAPVSLFANVYTPAEATVNTTSVDFGNVHVNDTVAAQTITVTNSASATALNDALTGSMTTSGAPFSGSGTLGTLGLGAGQSSSGLQVGLDTSAAGHFTGTANFTLASHDGELSDLPLADQSAALSANVYAYASPTVSSANSLNFGVVQVGQTRTDQLTVGNTLTAADAAYQEGLDASFGGSSDPQLTTNGGTITNLGAGLSDSSAMAVTLAPVTAGALSGAVTLDFASNGSTTSGLGTTPLDPQHLDYSWQVTGTAVNRASPSITPNPVTLAARVGDTASQALTVANVATAAPQASLDAQLGATTGAASASGPSINQLAAGSTDNTSFVVGLDTGTAGHQTGTVQIALQSDSTPNGCASDCLVDLPDATVTVSGNIYTPAVAAVSTGPIDFGIVHVDDTVGPQSITVTNSAATTALNDVLTGSVAAGGAPFSASGTLGAGLGAGASSSAMQVGLDTGTAGIYSGTAHLAFASHDDELADLMLTGQDVDLTAQVNNYADLAFTFGSGIGALSFDGSSDLYTLDLGDVLQGSGTTNTMLTFLNDNPLDESAYTDWLSSSGTIFSGSGFTFSGASVTELGGGATQDGFEIGLSSLDVGSFDELLSFNVGSGNGSGFFDPDIGVVKLRLMGTVMTSNPNPPTSVPEPGNLVMLLGGLALLGWLRRLGHRRRQAHHAR